MKAVSRTLLIFSFTLVTSQAEDKGEKALKQYEENVHVAARYPVKAFKRAIEDGDTSAVKRFLGEGFPVSLPMPWSKEEWEGWLPPTDYPIHLAVGSGHVEIVRLLLDRGANPKARGCEGNPTPLHLANDLEIAKLLISRGADVNARYSDGEQPIHNATLPAYLENRRKEAVANSFALVKLLMKHGADPLAKDNIGYQPIHVAAGTSTAEVVAFFLEHNAKVDAVVRSNDEYFNNGLQPLHYAASREDVDEALEVVDLLIRNGADVNATTDRGETPLHLSKSASMTRFLLSHKARPNIMSTGIIKRQPIHHFAMEGDVESLKLLLDHGAGIEAASACDEQTTPLDTAVFWGRKNAVKFLLERGAKPTERTMMNARRFNDTPIEIVSLLHQHGGIVSPEMFLRFPKDHNSLLPLLAQKTKDELIKQSAQHIAEAAEAGNLDIIRDFVSLGAKADQPWKNLLPIHHAMASGKKEVIEYFLSAGQPIDARCNARDEDLTPPMAFTDLQPIHFSIVKPELIPFLIKKGAKIDATTGEGWQPIHFAAAFGDSASLRAIIKAGGDPSVKNRDGKTPLQLAEEHAKCDCVDFLKSQGSLR